MVWWWAVAIIVAAVVSVVMSPKPENAKPVGLNEFDVPTAEVGREIPVLFGTRDIKGANVVWFGDLSVDPIKSEGGKK